MKPETGKKSKKWLWIAIAIAVLLIAAAVAAILIFKPDSDADGGEPTKPVEQTQGEEIQASAVYWNLDRIQYTQDPEAAGLSTRTPGEDGLYTFRFASEGKLVELKTADKQLVNYIDTMDAVGLVLDADGLIIEVLNVKDIAVEKAKNFYVKKVDGNTVTVNSSIAMNGMDVTVVIPETAGIMDVRPGSETLGQAIDLQVFDMVSIYCTKEGEVVTAVYLHERPESSPLYMRVDRLYDSATASTTRVPDAKGVYTIPFALNGEVVELKCKDKNIVTGIDSGTDAKQVMGLTFDEEGYITGTITAATAARGKIACTVYNVTAINGNSIETTRLMSGSEQGKVVNFNLTEETQIIMNENGCNHFIGERVEDLKMYDRIIVWTDMDNNALYIKIDRRKVEGDDISMYYLKGRKYDSTKLETSRVPDASGYYVYELANKGKMVTVKTKNKELANLMDGNSYQFFGLKVKGSIVQEYYDKDCLSGGYGIGGQRFVTEVMSNIVRIVSGTDFSSGGNYILTEKTEIYNMTGYNGKLGGKTELKVGDRVIASRDVENNITHIYVLDRPASGSTKFYYNASRKWDSTNLCTSRTPDADGYYVYTMYCEGKEVEVKTKDKDIANIIDEQNAPIAALKVNSEGIVTAAYPAIAGKKYASKVFNYNYVGEITKDKVVSCYYFSSGVRMEASKSYPMAKNCKIYNVSTNYSDHRGEKSSLKVGDRIQALYDIETGELTHIWIMGRSIDSPLYFHTNRLALKNGVTQRVPDADGYYSVELFADGEIKTYKTKSQEIMTAVDNYGSESFFAMKTDGNIILAVDGPTSSKKAANQVVSFRDVTKISGSNITATRMRPGGTDHMQQTQFKITSKTKIYDVSYMSENQFKAVKLEKGDRISVFADRDGNVTYVFVMYPHTREEGYQSKCSHCNKTVWWEPYCGSFIQAENVHYYYPSNYVRSGQGTVGVDLNSKPGTERYTAVFDMNGKTYTAKARNFLVYFDLVIIDSVGGGVLQSTGYNGGNGGNFMVAGGTVEINDGVTVRMLDDPNSRSGAGGNFHVSNFSVKDGDGKVTKTNVGKVTINDAVLEGWPNSSGNFLMNNGTVLNLNGGTVKGGNIQLSSTATFNWKGGKIESNLTIDGGTLALSGKPDFTGILMNTNGGKVDISNLSTEATIKAIPSGVFTTESDNIDAYLSVFQSAAPEVCTIVKDGKALSAGVIVPEITDNLTFVPGTQMAVCPLCEQMATWTPITQEKYGEARYGAPAAGAHIYLAEDIVHTGNTSNFMDAPSRDTTTNTPYSACFHLNGHNFTATNRNVIHGGYGILNVMGSGVVSGNGTSGATITINTNRDIGGVVLHSGTYVKAEGNKTGVVQINSNGGNIIIGKDAVVKTAEDELAVKLAGGNCIDSNLIINGTVEGGYVESVKAVPQSATADIDGESNEIFFALDGGNLKGGAKLAADTIIGLAGAAKVSGSGLNLTSGAKILISELTEGASIAVAANGVFTEAWTNMAEQKGYYVPAPKYLAIQEIEGCLSVTRDPNAAPDLPKDPATPAKPTLLSVDNSNLVFEEGTTNAKCPVCNEVVTWTAITDVTGVQALEGGVHYYLPADILYEQATLPYIQVTNTTTAACLHLNGHNITATNAMVVEAKGKLNIMGNGIVSGNGQPNETVSSRPDLQAATLQIHHGNAVVNLYGGTYVKSAANDTRETAVNGTNKVCGNHIIGTHGNGGIINMFDGATIDATGTSKQAVRCFWGWFNMYGGEIKGGTATAVEPGNWTSTKSGQFLMQGGKVTASSGAAISVSGIAGAPGKLYIYGGEVVGTVNYSRESEVIIGGNPKLNRLQVPTNMAGTYEGKFTLGKLTAGADITVYGSNVIFTTQSENVETYKQYFKAQSGKEVYVKDYALALKAGGSVTPDPEPDTPPVEEDPKVPALPSKLTVDNSNLTLDGSNQAKCPVCEQVVTWTAITSGADVTTLIGDTHYYLANDITYEGTDTAIKYPYSSEYARKTACLHLNGKNLTATNGLAIFAGNYLNIMGNGTVSGNMDNSSRASTIEANSSVAKLNIYGGTYKKSAATNERDLLRMNSAGGIINIYQGVIVDSRDTKGNTACVLNGTLNIYGGELYGGTTGHVASAGYGTSSGNPVAGTINVFGGLLQAKAASGLGASGSNEIKAKLNIYGGDVRGGTAVKTTADVIVGGTAKMNRLVVQSGAKITLAEMSEGASITVSATGIFTNPSSNANTYVKYFHGLTGYKTPTVVNNALFTEQGTDEPQQPTLPADPATPAKPALLSVDNAALTLDGSNQAKCPVCNQTVTWTAITDTAAQQVLAGGNHYYLTGDLTTDLADTVDGYIKAADETAACLHLNGHNITATATTAIYATGKLNVMGNGTVSGAGMADANANYTKHRGAAVEVHNANAVVNLYGGIYAKPAGNTRDIIGMFHAGGTLNLFDGVTVNNAGEAGRAVRNFWGTINIYGGTYVGGTGASAIMANNWSPTKSGTVNIFGGNLSGTKGAVSGGGQDNAHSVIGIYGGTISYMEVGKNSDVTVGGNPTLRLHVPADRKFTLGQLTTGAKITVSAANDGVISNQSANAETYKTYFTAQDTAKEVTVVNYALSIGAKGTTPAPEPEQPATFDNSNLVFEEGTQKAMCPVCGEVKEWIAITQEAHGENGAQNPNEAGKHYYLAEDITYTGTANFFQGPGSSRLLCIHLNGHNWTGTQGQFLFGYGSKSRVMGNGIVANGKNSARSGAVIWNTGTKSNVDIQLYGGTYTVTPENTKGSAISIDTNGGDITIHEGATVIGSPTAPAIYVGISNMRTSVLTIKGAQVYGTVQINAPKTPATYATTVVVEDAKLNVVELAKDVSFTVKGNTTIEKLIVAEGAKFTVGELGANAKINVQGNGTITEASANVATYKDQIISTYGCELKVVDNAIVARDLNKIDNSNLVFAEGTTKAVCPYCQVEVEWEAISDASAQVNLQAKKHYYLANDLSFSTIANTGTGLMYDFYGAANMTCLHLNGHNITSNGRAIYPGGYLNIMGNGIVSGNYTHASQIRGATMDVNGGNSSRLNLFGGTYTKNAENTKMPVIAVFDNGGNINIYAGATIDGTDTSVNSAAANCLLIANKEGKPGNVTMYGGTIQNGTNTANHGGNVRVGVYGNFTMYGGTITGGAAPTQYGGNIYSLGTLNLLGGTVSNGNGRIGGNIATQKVTGGAPVVVLKNVVISGGWGKVNTAVEGSVSHGGNVSVERTTMTIEDGTYIHGGNPENQGGNLRALYCNITMNGGYITDGHVGGTNVTENVWIVGSEAEGGSFTMNGGVIYANSATIGAGSGIQASAYTTVTLAGDAMVISNPANPNKPIYINAAATLVKDPSWTGIGASNKD